MLRNLAQKVQVLPLLAPQTLTATTATASFDLQGCRNFAFAVQVGAMSFSGTDKLTLQIQDSDVNSGFEDVTAEALYTPAAQELAAAGDANKVHLVQYRGNKRFVRLNIVEAGTVSVPIAVSGLVTELEVQPS
jgi:hypothetical protein